MTGQQTLDSASSGGLWPRYIAAGAINDAAWLRARADISFVGNCRRCGDYLIPHRPHEHAGRKDYTASCRAAGCGYELSAPGGRILRGSSRRSDQPKTGA